MKKYNFDNIVDRKKTGSYKWNIAKEDFIPLWVADMDFRISDEITEALDMRANQGAFGYPMIPLEYYEAEILWWKKRFNTDIKKEWIQGVTGVIPALSSLVPTFCEKGDGVIIQTPVYNHFHMSIEKNGASILFNDLLLENDKYVIDFENFEELASREDTKLFILCNPHNPIGRCWTAEELKRLGDICLKHNGIVISDEIHRDLVFKGYKHIPFLSVSDVFKEISITCTSPSKTFNLAGLRVANMVIPNKTLFDKVNKLIMTHEVAGTSVFGVSGLIAAYKYGDSWLEQLMEYLDGNRKYLIKYLKKELPDIWIADLEGTYLMWVDISKYVNDVENIQKDMLKKTKVLINPGENYSNKAKKFIRINIATNRETLEEGLKRIVNYLKEKN